MAAPNIAQKDRTPKQKPRLRRAIGRLGDLFVPYTGAKFNIDLGARALTTTGLGTFGDVAITSPVNIYALSHDSFADFVANEHINHTSVTLTTGDGLSGSGDISANRTFAVDLATDPGLEFDSAKLRVKIKAAGGIVRDSDGLSVSAATLNHNDLANIQGGAAADYYHFTSAQYTDLTDTGASTLHYHASDRARANHTGTQTAATISDFAEAAQDAVGGILDDGTVGNIAFTYDDAGGAISAVTQDGEIDHDSLQNYDANKHIDHTGVSITGATGCAGGGTIATSRTITLDINGLSSDTIAVGDWIAHYQTVSGIIKKSTITTLTGVMDHNSLNNYVADQHVAHTGVTLTAGTGISGGGDISAGRTFDLDILNLTTDTIAAGDWVPFHDLTDAPNKITFANFEATLAHDSLSGYDANKHIDHTGVTLTAGTGISGGGDISAGRTFDLDILNLTTDTIAAGDWVPFHDLTDAPNKITFANFEATLDHGNLAGLDTGADHSYIDQAVTVAASPTFAGLSVGADQDINVSIGRSIISGASDQARFSHIDHNSAASYAILQDADGNTNFNCATGKLVKFRINNVTEAYFTAAGLYCYDNYVYTTGYMRANQFNCAGADGLSATYSFGGGGSGDIATMTFAGGILTGITLVP